MILYEKLCSRAIGFEKLLLRSAVCMLWQVVVVKCKLVATLNLAIPKFGSSQYFSIKVANGFYNKRGCISSNCRLTV